MTVGNHIACSNKHELVACVGERVNIFDIEQRIEVVSCCPIAYACRSVFSPNGRFLAVKSTTGRIAVLNALIGEVVCDHENSQEGEGCEVHFSPDGEMLIDASWDGVITVRKAFEPEIVSRIEFPREMIGQISHDFSGRKWLFLHIPKLKPEQRRNDPPYLILRDWPFEEGNLQRIPLDPNISSCHTATISPDASRICYEHNIFKDREICILRAEDGGIETTAKTDSVRAPFVWSWDGQIIAAAQRQKSESKFTFYRSSDLSVLGDVPCEYPSSICFLPGNDQVVLGTWQFSPLARLEDFLSGLVKMQKSTVS